MAGTVVPGYAAARKLPLPTRCTSWPYPTSPAKICVMPQWEFLASEPDVWKPFSFESSEQIEQAFILCQARLQVTIDRYRYDIDLENLMQTNCQTSRKRAVRRQMVLDMQATVQATLRAQEHKIRELTQQLEREQCEVLGFMAAEVTMRQDLALREHQLHVQRSQIKQLAQDLAMQEESVQAQSSERLELQRLLKDVGRQLLCGLDLPDTATLSSTANLASGNGKFLRRPLDRLHPEFRALEDMFFQSMVMHRASRKSDVWCEPPNVEITAIEEVVNSNMQSLYEAARTGEVRERNPQGCSEIEGISAWKCSSGKSGQEDLNEYLLFHGCPKGHIESIARSGFDPQLSGTATGAMFGQGTYFAENASKSDLYTTCDLCAADATCVQCNHAHGMRQMIVARVLLGESVPVKSGDPQRRTAILRPGSGQEGNSRVAYDSHTALPKARGGAIDHMEFIVFKQQMALLRYVITYRHKQCCTCHMCGARRDR